MKAASSSLTSELKGPADDSLRRLEEVDSAMAEAQTDLEVAQSSLRTARTAADKVDADVRRANAEFQTAKATADKAQQTLHELQGWRGRQGNRHPRRGAR